MHPGDRIVLWEFIALFMLIGTVTCSFAGLVLYAGGAGQPYGPFFLRLALLMAFLFAAMLILRHHETVLEKREKLERINREASLYSHDG